MHISLALCMYDSLHTLSSRSKALNGACFIEIIFAIASVKCKMILGALLARMRNIPSYKAIAQILSTETDSYSHLVGVLRSLLLSNVKVSSGEICSSTWLITVTVALIAVV